MVHVIPLSSVRIALFECRMRMVIGIVKRGADRAMSQRAFL